MNDLKEKLKKVAPIISSKETQFNLEMTTLSQIKDLKIAAIQYLKQNQQKYIEGVDLVNQERRLGNLDKAAVLEPAIEFVKQKWHESLKEVQKLEREQEKQVQKVLDTQRELKSFQALDEKYRIQIKEHSKAVEQKIMDEIAQMRAHREDNGKYD